MPLKTNITINNEFECQLFNQADLAAQIFQYLDLHNLNNCSLVNLNWLYHSFKNNSLYHLRLGKWLVSQLQYMMIFQHNDLPLTVWQRLINVKKIDYISKDLSYGWGDYRFDNRFLAYFALLQNVEQLRFDFNVQDDWITEGDISILKIFSDDSHGKKIKHLQCCLHCNTDRPINIDWIRHHDNIILMKSLPVMRMRNVKSIWLKSIAIPFICSDKCKELSLTDVKFTNILYQKV